MLEKEVNEKLKIITGKHLDLEEDLTKEEVDFLLDLILALRIVIRKIDEEQSGKEKHSYPLLH